MDNEIDGHITGSKNGNKHSGAPQPKDDKEHGGKEKNGGGIEDEKRPSKKLLPWVVRSDATGNLVCYFI